MPSFLILLSYISLIALGLADNIRGPVFPDYIQYFSLSNSQGSLFFTCTSVMSLLSGYTAQFVIQKLGRVRTLQASLLLLVISQFGIALSPSFYGTLFFALIFGLAMGTMGVAQNVLVIAASPPGKLQKMQSGLHSIYGAVSLMAPVVVNFCAWMWGSWSAAFFLTGILGVLVLIPTFKKVEERYEAHEDQAQTEASRSEQVFFSLILASYVAAELMVSTRLALFVRREHNYTLESANWLNSGFFLFLMIGRLLFIFWQPKRSIKLQMTLSLLGSLVLIFLGLYWHPWCLALAGLAMAPFYPLTMTMAGKMFSKSLDVVASYCIAMSGVTVVLMHQWVGLMSDYVGLVWALWIGPFFILLSLFCIFIYSNIFKHRREIF